MLVVAAAAAGLQRGLLTTVVVVSPRKVSSALVESRRLTAVQRWSRM